MKCANGTRKDSCQPLAYARGSEPNSDQDAVRRKGDFGQ